MACTSALVLAGLLGFTADRVGAQDACEPELEACEQPPFEEETILTEGDIVIIGDTELLDLDSPDGLEDPGDLLDIEDLIIVGDPFDPTAIPDSAADGDVVVTEATIIDEFVFPSDLDACEEPCAPDGLAFFADEEFCELVGSAVCDALAQGVQGAALDCGDEVGNTCTSLGGSVSAVCDDPNQVGFCEPEPEAEPNPIEESAEDSVAFEAVVSRSDVSDDLDVEIAGLPPEEIAAVAAGRVLLGLDALAELGALRRTPDPADGLLIRSVRDTVPSAGLTEAGYRREVERLAEDLPTLVEQLEAAGVVVSPSLFALLEELNQERVAAVSAGESSIFDPEPWIAAIADLWARGGVAPEAGQGRADDETHVLGVALLFAEPEVEPAPEAATIVPADADLDATNDPAVPSTVPASSPATVQIVERESQASPQSGFPLWAFASLGAIATIVVLIRRRRLDRTVMEADAARLSVMDLLEASRRMGASLDSKEICEIALAESARLVDSDGGVVAVFGPQGLMAIHSDPPSLFMLDELEGSTMQRVSVSGRTVTSLASDEPILGGMPMAIAVVPIMSDDEIVGSFMAARIESRPFGREDLDVLEMLAGLMGSALRAADVHDSATALMDVEPLTGLKNRRRLDRDLAALGDDVVSYIMLDVDHFKHFNDTNGHTAGDEALRRVAASIEESVRPSDVVYRYGGEEFCVLLPDTETHEALVIAERIRAGVEHCEIPGEKAQPGGAITVSVGVADTASKPSEDLVERADSALYSAKHAGRNRVATFD